VQLLETKNTQTGAVRYFINSRRVSRAAFHAAKIGRTLECFHGVTRGRYSRAYCCAR
jgi:hypothetical protein